MSRALMPLGDVAVDGNSAASGLPADLPEYCRTMLKLLGRRVGRVGPGVK